MICAVEFGASGWLNGGFGGGQKNQVRDAAASQPMTTTTTRPVIRFPILRAPNNVPPESTGNASPPSGATLVNEFERRGTAHKLGDWEKSLMKQAFLDPWVGRSHTVARNKPFESMCLAFAASRHGS
jgi:hypothetical protein